jgi:hypothetical protein
MITNPNTAKVKITSRVERELKELLASIPPPKDGVDVIREALRKMKGARDVSGK